MSLKNDSDMSLDNSSLLGSSNESGLNACKAAVSDTSLCTIATSSVAGLVGKESNFENSTVDEEPIGLGLQNAAFAGGISHLTVHLSNLDFKKTKRKRMPKSAKPRCGTISRRQTRLKSDKKMPLLTNPYFNFLRAYRSRYDQPQATVFVQKAALFWSKLNERQRSLFKPENLERGVSALGVLNHLEYWRSQKLNNIESLQADDTDDNEDSCCPKRRKRRSCPRKPSCRRKRRSCPRKKRRSCRKKRRSCRRKKKTCRRKRRTCRPKRRACRPKPRCRPKRRCG